MAEDRETIKSAIKKLESRLKELCEEQEGLLKDLKYLQHKLSAINSSDNTSAVIINTPLTLQEKNFSLSFFIQRQRRCLPETMDKQKKWQQRI